MPLDLASRVNWAAHSRTCATEPGADCSASEYSVWIVPGGTNKEGEIDDVLEKGGIRVLERVSLERAEARAEDIVKKFTAVGFSTEKEFLCND